MPLGQASVLCHVVGGRNFVEGGVNMAAEITVEDLSRPVQRDFKRVSRIEEARL